MLPRMASKRVKASPPRRSVGTWLRPANTPTIRATEPTRTRAAAIKVEGRQSCRWQMAIQAATMSRLATTGRQASSNG